MKARKAALVILAVLLLALAIGGVLIATHWPFSQANVIQSLQEDFPATVTFQKFHSTFFPHPGCVGEGLAFRRLGSYPNTPPIVTIQRFTVEAHYIDMLLRPGHLARIIMNGFRVYVPPPGTPKRPPAGRNPNPQLSSEKSSLMAPPSKLRAPTMILLCSSKSTPLSWPPSVRAILCLTMSRCTTRFPQAKFVATEISAHGTMLTQPNSSPGPVRLSKGRSQRLQRHWRTLSSHDDFRGILGHIESSGRIDIPDFIVTRSRHSLHLTADYHAFIDGTNGDVELERVTAAFLKTHVLANGQHCRSPGQHGKTASVDLSVHDGRIQDVLRMFVSEPKPPFNGVTSFRAHVSFLPKSAPSFKRSCLARISALKTANSQSRPGKKKLTRSVTNPVVLYRRAGSKTTTRKGSFPTWLATSTFAMPPPPL